MASRIVPIVWILVAGWTAAALAQPPIPIGGEITLAEETARPFSPPRTAVADGGRFLVVWEDPSAVPETRAIVGQLVTREGAVGEPRVVAAQQGVEQTRPEVSALDDGRFVVVWARRPDDGAPSMAARFVSASGEPLGEAFQVNQEAIEGDRTQGGVATLDNGEFVVAWRDTDEYDGPSYPFHDVVAQRFSDDGTRIGERIEVTLGATQRNDDVTLASRPDGGFVVAWKSLGYYGYYQANSRVMARTFDAGGRSTGKPIQINSDTERSNAPSSIAVADDGTFLVVWGRSGPLGDPPPVEARGRVFDAQGEARSDELAFSAEGWGPVAAADPNDSFLVVWSDASVAPASGSEIVAQRWGSDGQPLSAVEILNTSALGSQYWPGLATDPSGDTLVAWRDFQEDDQYNLLARRFQTPCRTDGDTLCLASERFRIDLDWVDFVGERGRGRVVQEQTDDSGLLWFFQPDNWEMLVKIVDGCGFNGHHWVFAAATTNVGYRLTVTDTESGEIRTYDNPVGTLAPAISDITAFATCP